MMLKYWFFCFLFYLSPFILCMNSTENRQHISDIDTQREVEFALSALWHTAYDGGDISSAKAYEIFMCFVDGEEPTIECNSEVISRLKSYRLANEYGIVDRDKVELMRPAPQIRIRGSEFKDNE